jgi:hypothetical protein
MNDRIPQKKIEKVWKIEIMAKGDDPIVVSQEEDKSITIHQDSNKVFGSINISIAQAHMLGTLIECIT